MEFIIGNKVIISPIDSILYEIRSQLTNGKLKDIQPQKGQNIRISCPNHEHKQGLERHASCDIFADRNDKETTYGTVHCFSCGYTASLDQFVNECFDESGDFGKQWLLEYCDTAFVSEVDYLPSINFTHNIVKKDYMDESSLQKYQYYHNYMWTRKLSKEIVDLFEVGYDPERDTLVFPVRDEYGRLVFITRRSVKAHFFMIPKEVEKPVYLLYYILQHHITRIIVTEGQIDALTAWSYGVPAVATMGSPSEEQIKLLNSSGVRIIITMFDNDVGGECFTRKFDKFIRKDVFLLHATLPKGVKDINDLTKEQFDEVMRNLT